MSNPQQNQAVAGVSDKSHGGDFSEVAANEPIGGAGRRRRRSSPLLGVASFADERYSWSTKKVKFL